MKISSLSLVLLLILSSFTVWATAQGGSQENSAIRIEVALVQLNIAVTDSKGNYVTDLSPSDFQISEDGIPQKIASFERGNEEPKDLAGAAPVDSAVPADPKPAPTTEIRLDGPPQPTAPANASAGLNSVLNGANVFILFDTSNYMYRRQGFVYAQDAIAEFVRSLDNPYKVAFYSYSRDIFRAAALTSDRSEVMRGVRATVNGDDSALYNALLLTLKDAGQLSGRKVVVVFSNGPDNSSMVAPEDVSELAQSEGIPIYMISTQDAKLDKASSAVFERMSSNTGGEAYYASDWKDERKAFASIREDLAHLYYLSYYPQPNPNHGWRAITVKLAGPNAKKYHIRTRSGYRPIPARIGVDTAAGAQTP